MPVAQRIAVAQRFDAAIRHEETMGEVRRLIRRILADAPDRMDWLLGRDGN